jgi:hypothetical protein
MALATNKNLWLRIGFSVKSWAAISNTDESSSA